MLAAGVVYSPDGSWKRTEEMLYALSRLEPENELVKMGTFTDSGFKYNDDFSRKFLSFSDKTNPWTNYSDCLEKSLSFAIEKIAEKYIQLKEEKPNHDLLSLINVNKDNHSILLTKKFREKYMLDSEITPYPGLTRYNDALDTALNEEEHK